MRVLAATLLLAALAPAGAAPAASAKAPQRIVVPGLKARADILVDHWGVPHIYASSAHDLFFAQGWNAARDRLWQIDLWRRSGLGELSAALGSAYTAQDRAIRLFVYRGDLKSEWAAYGPQAKSRAAAFVAGINAYVTATRRDHALLPKEFVLAGYEPALWNAEDIVRIRNHGLVVGVGFQVLRAEAACKAGVDASSTLLSVSPPWTPIVPEGLDLCSIPAHVLDQYQLAQKHVSFGLGDAASASAAEVLPLAADVADRRVQGSNNWVLDSSKTTTGRPILANDPHRADEVPSLRYIAHLVAPGIDAIGAGEPSLPGISIGHNDKIAFGLTVFPIAQEDLYVYDTNPANPSEYRYQGGWEAMKVVHEKVVVRGGGEVDIELKFTRHGPVVMEDAPHQRAYAVRATWLGTGGTPYFASMRYLEAHSIEQFASALRYWGEPGENQIVADTSGKIGWFPSGFTPVRHNSDGLFPLPGDGRYEWDGIMDRNLLPSEIDPPRHYVATANQLNLPRDYPYRERRVGFVWYESDRFERISEVLEATPKLSIQDSQRLQNDYLSIPARRLLHVLGSLHTEDAVLADAIAWLRAWDGVVTADSPQAALYEVWIAHHLGRGMLAAAIPGVPENLRNASSGTEGTILELIEHPDARLGTEPTARRDEVLSRTLAAALAETTQRLGADRGTWAWGKLASVLFEHPLAELAGREERARMNIGPYAKAGDNSSVGAAYYRARDFRLTSGASFRMVLDVGAWDQSVAVNTPGESGDWASPHYKDLFPLWLAGDYFPLLYSRPAVERATEQRLRLVPR